LKNRLPSETAGECRCGFVAVIGAPNVGKSTLVNSMVGSKVTIVTPKVQTTRNVVRGIVNRNSTQLVFVDTPGIFQAKRRLERAMVGSAWSGSVDANVILHVVDAQEGTTAETDQIIRKLKKSGRQATLVLNKIDIIHKAALLKLTRRLSEDGPYSDVFMVSALSGDGLEDLISCLAKLMPSSPWLFPEDEVSDTPMNLLSADITREKLFFELQQELPYACAVETQDWKTLSDGSTRIEQSIFVRRESQRAIVLGKNGQRIKKIGQKSREELEEMLQTRVHLFLHVKVYEKWRDDRRLFVSWGLDFNA